MVIPDEQALTLWGADPWALGVKRDLAAARAERVLVAEALPAALAPALRSLLSDVPDGAGVQRVAARPCSADPAALGWSDLDDLLADGPGEMRRGHGGHAQGHGHGHGHGHGDMMAIVGDPSADGLVMEPIEFEHGPLASALPGGLVLRVVLDGDVVARCDVDQTLVVPGVAQGALCPDPFAPASWRAVIDQWRCRDGAGSWPSLVEVEIERALSHLAWLRSFADLLGWPQLRARCQPAIGAVLTLRREPGPRDEDFAGAHAAALGLQQWLACSRRLGLRTKRCGSVDDATAGELAGPAARACGLERDARTGDERYRELGFVPVVEQGGDALARTLVRLREAVQSIELASQARQVRDRAWVPPRRAVVEGPRGGVGADVRDGRLVLDGGPQSATRRAAGDAAIGHEWAAALVAVASFDLSPWRVGP